MKKLMTGIIVLVIIGLAVLFAAGYFLGNVPIISGLLGTNKSVELGVTISADVAQTGLKNMKMPTSIQDLQAIAANPQSAKTVKATLSQEEVSSLLALGDIPDFPLKLTQVRFNPDGTAESSGVLDTAVLKTFLKNNGIGKDVIDQINSYMKVDGKVNYYTKGTCKIENNRVSLDITSLQIGKVEVPGNVISQNSGAVSGFVSQSLVSNGFNVRKLTTGNGKVDIDADRPLSSLQPWLGFAGK
jgi:hypothetical protein